MQRHTGMEAASGVRGRPLLVDRPASAIVVALDGDRLLAVRQPRPGAGGARLLELPAGSIEPGETPLAAAQRELREECGVTARTWRAVGTFWAAPSYSTQFVHVFEASGLAAAAEGGSGEDIAVERLTPAELELQVDEASTLAALHLWRRGESRQ